MSGVTSGYVQFGYTGQRTGDARASITPDDVRWLCRYLGRITNDQLRTALGARSGATPEEVESFTSSLRSRIEQLRAI